MLRRDLNIFLNAAQISKRKVLVVEGISDKKILKICAVNISRLRVKDASNIDISTVEDIEFPLPIFSNKEKVRYLHSQAKARKIKVACLIDREFDDFLTDLPLQDQVQAEIVEGRNLFRTRGHSIENYFFELDYVLEALTIKYASELEGNFDSVIETNYNQIASFSAAISLAALKCNLIKKIEGALEKSLFIYVNNKVMFNYSRVESLLFSRSVCISDIEKFISHSISYKAEIERLNNIEFSKWITHGHIGYKSMWAIISMLVSDLGNETVINQICRGHGDDKISIMANRWSRTPEEKSLFLLKNLWKWLNIW